MKKLGIFVCLIALVFCGTAHAADISINDAVQASDGSANLSASGVVTVYTQSEYVSSGVYYTTMYKAVSATSAPDVTITFEESYTTPATEGSSDSNWVAPEAAVDINTNLTTEVWHQERLLLIPNRYYRYKIVGNAGNATDTIVNIKTVKQSFNT